MTTVAEMATIEERLSAMRRAGFWSPDEAARFDALRSSEYCLVRIDGAGERWRCNRCNQKHAHFTYWCVERPFKGLAHGLYAYWANVGNARSSDLSPSQRERLDVLAPIFGNRPVPLAQSHPATSAGLETPDRDVLVGAQVLGSIDPISRAKARLLVEIINSRAGQAVLRL